MGRIIGGRTQHEYERVKVDEWLTGVIEAVQYDPQRSYNVKDKDTGAWEKATAPHMRFKFRLDGYEFPHYSRWMRASTHEKSNLYDKYLRHLCPVYDCMDKLIDLDKLVGAKVKVMWENNEDYQNVSQIRGLDPELNVIASGIEATEGARSSSEGDGSSGEESPFPPEEEPPF